MTGCGASQPPVELRGVWLTNVDSEVLDSRESIDEAMAFLADHHFNVVFPVVWNDAHTLYPSALVDSLFGGKIHPRFAGRDPLQEVVEAAHRHGLKVMPWFEYGFAASYKKNGGRLLKARPEWAAKDVEGKLLTKNGFEWMNGYHPEVQQFLIDMVCEVVRNYDVDGVQGDDRLPAQPSEGGYSAVTAAMYKAATGYDPPANHLDPGWLRWRAEALSDFAGRLYEAVKAVDPAAVVSWAPSVYPWSYREYLQDWPTWIARGYADLVVPQVYRYDIERYRATIDALAPESLGVAPPPNTLYPGVLMNVGTYVIAPDYLAAALEYHRSEGYGGEVFFFYEGLRKDGDRLAKLLKATVYAERAVWPGEPAK